MVGVDHSGHGVDLEVLVGANTCCRLNRSPVRPGWFSVVEPLVGKVLNVVSVNLGNTSRPFAASHVPSLLKHRCGNALVHDRMVVVAIHEVVVESVASPNDFNVVHVVTVDSGHTNTAVVHLPSKDFITEEVISPKTTVRVREIVTVRNRDVRECTNHGMVRVVLFLHVVDML